MSATWYFWEHYKIEQNTIDIKEKSKNDYPVHYITNHNIYIKSEKWQWWNLCGISKLSDTTGSKKTWWDDDTAIAIDSHSGYTVIKALE